MHFVSKLNDFIPSANGTISGRDEIISGTEKPCIVGKQGTINQGDLLYEISSVWKRWNREIYHKL
jgi:hypothetical protein